VYCNAVADLARLSKQGRSKFSPLFFAKITLCYEAYPVCIDGQRSFRWLLLLFARLFVFTVSLLYHRRLFQHFSRRSISEAYTNLSTAVPGSVMGA
jgi:hypothetical protein